MLDGRPPRRRECPSTRSACLPRPGGRGGGRRLTIATLAIGLSLTFLPACGVRAPTSAALGLFVPSQNPTDAVTLAKQLGITLQGVSGYTTGTTWATIGKYEPPTTSLRLFLSVSMSPDDGKPSQTPAHLGVYRELAQNLVTGGQARAIVRIGWEWSAPYFSWSPQHTTPGQYVTAFRDIATTMRRVPGEHFQFDWCSNSGSVPTNGPFAASFPGDAYVDYVGTDQYDNPGTSWIDDLNSIGGLAYTVAFAKAHGKRVSIPEWGLNGNDDPTFVDLMHSFIADPGNEVAYSSYFSDAGAINSDITLFPHAEVELTREFGAARASRPAHATRAPGQNSKGEKRPESPSALERPPWVPGGEAAPTL